MNSFELLYSVTSYALVYVGCFVKVAEYLQFLKLLR